MTTEEKLDQILMKVKTIETEIDNLKRSLQVNGNIQAQNFEKLENRIGDKLNALKQEVINELK